MNSTFPQYASVRAQISSQPHGFSTRRGSKAQASSESMFGESIASPTSGDPLTVSGGEPVGVRGDVLRRCPKLLRRVHREPEPLVPVGVEPTLGRELGESRVLVVAALGESVDRL